MTKVASASSAGDTIMIVSIDDGTFSANWLAGLVVRHIIDIDEANKLIAELAIGLAKQAYKIQIS